MSAASDRPAIASLSGDEAASPAAPDAGSGSLDKVRDILFGAQARDFERRFARLEERLLKDTSDLREDVRKRLEVLEQFVRREAESLADRIADLSRAHERSAAGFDERLAREQREARQQLLDQNNRLSEEIRQKTDDLLAALAREANDLRTDKTSRADLAALLTEMAMRLNHEFTLPGNGDRHD
jgi:hypothetical protein